MTFSQFWDDLTNKNDRNISELIPIRDFNEEEHCFVMTDGMYLDMVQWVTKDLATVGDAVVSEDIRCIQRFLQTFAPDIKIVALNFPSDTKIQQQFLQHKIKKSQNQLYCDILYGMLEQQEWIEKNYFERNYFLFFYCKSQEELRENRNLLQRSLGSGNLIEQLEDEQKFAVLHKMSNKNSYIF